MKSSMSSAARIMLCLMLCALMVTAGVPDEQKKAVEIPLKNVWAYDMAGITDVRKLDDNKSGPLTERIRSALGPQALAEPGPITMPKPGDGFAVAGTGRDALRQAHSVLVRKQKPQEQFAATSEVTVVFTAIQSEFYVRLHQVQRVGKDLIVRYRFVPHEEEEVTEHFALIPIGKLPVGKYSVKFVQSQMESEYLAAGFEKVSNETARRIVCGPFTFSVVKGKRN